MPPSECAFRLQVHDATNRAGIHVGGQRLHDLDALDEIGGNLVHFETAFHAAERRCTGALLTIQRHHAEIRVHAADHHGGDVALLFELRHAGHAHDESADVQVGDIAERVGGHDGFDVVGIALRGDRGGIALALAGDDELVELVDRGGQRQFVIRAPIGHDGHPHRLGVEPGVGGGQRIQAGGHLRKNEFARRARERGEVARLECHDGALEVGFRAGIADAAGHRAETAGVGGNLTETRRGDNEEEQRRGGEAANAKNAKRAITRAR